MAGVLTMSQSILQFHCDEEVLAWRAIGLAARAALEMGLHHREPYFAKFDDLEQRRWANKLFWCIYVLDRRWSFGTGLPFAINDHDIDPELPEPVRDLFDFEVTDSKASMREANPSRRRIQNPIC